MVYVLARGEDDEGGSIVAIYDELWKANAAARAMPFYWDSEDEEELNEDGGVRRHGGCDWIEVHAYEVH